MSRLIQLSLQWIENVRQVLYKRRTSRKQWQPILTQRKNQAFWITQFAAVSNVKLYQKARILNDNELFLSFLFPRVTFSLSHSMTIVVVVVVFRYSHCISSAVSILLLVSFAICFLFRSLLFTFFCVFQLSFMFSVEFLFIQLRVWHYLFLNRMKHIRVIVYMVVFGVFYIQIDIHIIFYVFRTYNTLHTYGCCLYILMITTFFTFRNLLTNIINTFTKACKTTLEHTQPYITYSEWCEFIHFDPTHEKKS